MTLHRKALRRRAFRGYLAALRSPDAGVLRSRIVLSPEAWARFCALAGLPTTDGAL